MSVGRYLTYTPGNITLLATSTSTPGTLPVAAVAGGVAGGVTVLLLLLALVVAAILVAHHRGSPQKTTHTGDRNVQLLLKQEGTNRGTVINSLCGLADFLI